MDDRKTTAALHKKKGLQQQINYRKVDAPLAAAVEEIENTEDPTLAIFIYTARSRDEAATIFLHRLGIRVYSTNQEIFTATVSPHTVKELSQQPWVRFVKLSQKLHMLN